MTQKWIFGTSDVDADWDTYIATIKELGYDTREKIYNDVYCFGSMDEFDWEKTERDWNPWYYSGGQKTYLFFDLDGVTPYGLYMKTADIMLFGDAGDCFNPGTVSLFVNGQKVWTVTAGVCPGHFAAW